MKFFTSTFFLIILALIGACSGIIGIISEFTNITKTYQIVANLVSLFGIAGMTILDELLSRSYAKALKDNIDINKKNNALNEKAEALQKANDDIQKQVNELLEDKTKLINKEKKVSFELGGSDDNQFEQIVSTLKSHQGVEILILNYTNTPFPTDFAEHLLKAIFNVLAIKMSEPKIKHVNATSYIRDDLFISWTKVFELLHKYDKSLGVKQIKLKLDGKEDLAKPIETAIDELDENPNRAKYLVYETYWLITESDTGKVGNNVKRMYYLDPMCAKETIRDRFLFACATMINCMCSPRYSIAILPARLHDKQYQEMKDYSVVCGSSISHSSPVWVLSGLQNSSSDTEKTQDYMFIRCSEAGDQVIGAKCKHVAGHLYNLWDELISQKLVLCDHGTIYLARICQFALQISILFEEEPDQQKSFIKLFKIFLDEVYELSEKLPDKLNLDCENYMEQQISNKENLKIWFEDDLHAFNSMFLGVTAFNCSFISECDIRKDKENKKNGA